MEGRNSITWVSSLPFLLHQYPLGVWSGVGRVKWLQMYAWINIITCISSLPCLLHQHSFGFWWGGKWQLICAGGNSMGHNSINLLKIIRLPPNITWVIHQHHLNIHKLLSIIYKLSIQSFINYPLYVKNNPPSIHQETHPSPIPLQSINTLPILCQSYINVPQVISMYCKSSINQP
jgi:hypothetical protein